MVSPKSERKKESVPCDFCSEQIAVLYCRADSAKLCLFCDQHVHSANLLSKKHLRSQICDNCSNEPVSVRCVTDNLVLCQECDWDAHGSCSVSASHDRVPIEGFSGCPSALELASLWGFDLEDKKLNETSSFNDYWNACQDFEASWLYKTNGMSVQDLMVPNEKGVFFNGDVMSMSKRQNPSCGKLKQVIYKQLVQLMKRGFMVNEHENLNSNEHNNNNNNNNIGINISAGGGGGGGDGGGGGGENLVPTTMNGLEDGVIEAAAANACVQQTLQQQTPFTSLLMMQGQMGSKENDSVVEGDMLWDGHSGGQGPQVLFLNLVKPVELFVLMFANLIVIIFLMLKFRIENLSML